MNLVAAVYSIIGAGAMGVCVGCAIHYWATRPTQAPVKSQPEVAPQWTVEVEPHGGYRLLGDDGEPYGDRFTCMVISCVRKRSPGVEIGRYDARKPDVQSKVAELQEQAEEHCTTLNAMDISVSSRYSW